jgi:hypothetical protein
MWSNGGSSRRTVIKMTKRRKHKSLPYKLAALTAPVFLIPVFIVIIVAFLLIFAPLLYLATSFVIIRSGWRATEVEYWATEE